MRQTAKIAVAAIIFLATFLWLGTNTGWHTATSSANDAATGDLAWIKLDSIFAEDGHCSTCSLDGVTYNVSNYLEAKGFGFSLPGDANISGIQTRIKWGVGSNPQVCQINDASVVLVADGLTQPDDKATTGALTQDALVWQTYGTSNDVWSWDSPNATSINSSGFAFEFQVMINVIGNPGVTVTRVDAVEAIITYTEAAGGPTHRVFSQATQFQIKHAPRTKTN